MPCMPDGCVLLAWVEAVKVTVALPLPPTVLGEARHVTFVSVEGTLQDTATVFVNPFSAPTETVSEAELPRLKERVWVELLS